MTELTSADLDAMERIAIGARAAVDGDRVSDGDWMQRWDGDRSVLAFMSAFDPSTIQRLIALARSGLSR